MTVLMDYKIMVVKATSIRWTPINCNEFSITNQKADQLLRLRTTNKNKHLRAHSFRSISAKVGRFENKANPAPPKLHPSFHGETMHRSPLSGIICKNNEEMEIFPLYWAVNEGVWAGISGLFRLNFHAAVVGLKKHSSFGNDARS